MNTIYERMNNRIDFYHLAETKEEVEELYYWCLEKSGEADDEYEMSILDGYEEICDTVEEFMFDGDEEAILEEIKCGQFANVWIDYYYTMSEVW